MLGEKSKEMPRAYMTRAFFRVRLRVRHEHFDEVTPKSAFALISIPDFFYGSPYGQII